MAEEGQDGAEQFGRPISPHGRQLFARAEEQTREIRRRIAPVPVDLRDDDDVWSAFGDDGFELRDLTGVRGVDRPCGGRVGSSVVWRVVLALLHEVDVVDYRRDPAVADRNAGNERSWGAIRSCGRITKTLGNQWGG
ncbi:hypothetical protein [Aurantimonas sp. 22II-16-19i]|uniref:hypothetical protein n=1 Tax=Aurantimonas sp. 22II-16-19i TaxID=1317114 RepID=UPI00111C70F9|nr:hypothetical protein [Aurantimonas sp. 22II-16-19i]